MVFGLLTKPLIRRLLPESSQTEPSSPTSSMTPLLENGPDYDDPENGNNRTLRTKPSLAMLFNSPTTTVHYYWRKFDDACMRPVFGGSGFVSYATGTRDMDVIH
ncbi:putative cation/H+ exchanger, CPA1 family [Helianthus annuus]|nr:putative cation/H+ exchanger, CPA1 family [Helianthus annuus]